MKRVRGTRTRQRDYDRKMAIRAFGDNAMRKGRGECQQQQVRETCYDIATADPTNIVQVRRCNCRFCWGANHEYQRTNWELARDLKRFQAANKKHLVFDQMGGSGFVKWRDPNPDCPICYGEGEEVGYIEDFRKLSDRERNLIAGIRFGKDGMIEEVRFHDKLDAIATFAKIDGMYIKRKIVRILEASEADLDAYFAQNGVDLDPDDPDLAPFLEKMTSVEDKE